MNGDSGWSTFGDMVFRRLLTPAFARLTWLVTLVLGALWFIASILITAATWGGTGLDKSAELFSLFKTLALILVVVMLIRVFLEIAMTLAARHGSQQPE
jgi:hypothetical protein